MPIRVCLFLLFPLILLLSSCPPPSSSGGGGGDGDSGPSYTPEGSILSPIEIPPNTSYSGQVDTTKSYYTTYGVSTYYVSVRLDDMSDDGDLIYYGTDDTFNTEVDRPLVGRTMWEQIGRGSGSTDVLYFVVDGSYATAGTAYTLNVESLPNSSATPSNHGLAGDPEPFPVGYVVSTSVFTTSYYVIETQPGTAYRANANTGVTLQFYLDDQFTNPVGSSGTAHCGPVTASGAALYLKMDGSDTWVRLEVVRREGSPSAPVPLFVEKTNYAHVDETESYFLFQVSSGASYDVEVSGFSDLSNDVDLFVFNSADFTSLYDSSQTAADPETCTVITTGSFISVRVDDKSLNGASFILKVTQN